MVFLKVYMEGIFMYKTENNFFSNYPERDIVCTEIDIIDCLDK